METEFSPAGHALVTFTRRNKTPLPIFSLQTGDVVRLASSHHKTGDTLSGTIYEKFSDRIIVAFNKELSEEWEREESFELYKSVNRITYRRMEEALDAVNETRNTRLAVFRDISFKEKKPTMEWINLDDIAWFDNGLNQSQKEAVRMALSAKDVGLVHGPPGTGKTTVLIEIIRQAVLRGHSVLVNAPSNTACDNILEMLIHKGINALRLGHPARIDRDLREHTLDFKLGQHAYGKLIVQNENELHRLFRTQERYRERRIPGSYAEREAGEEIRHLKQEVKILKKEVFETVMRETQVIVGTMTSIETKAIRDKFFDWVIIDEATQATEPLTWIPLTRARKVIMAGDHFQLPPTVRSKKAEKEGLGVTLFERFHDILDGEFKVLLERQYRMNEKIMGFSSRIFYKNLLVADESVKQQTLADMKGVKKTKEMKEPILFIDTAGKGFEEKLEEGSESRYNPEEAGLVLEQLSHLLSAGVLPSVIAVISPYSAQVRLLTAKTPHPDIEIDSVDGFQGREKEVVIVSLVRSNMEGEMGFLADTRRMNVAMTRARRKLIVIGDGSTLSSIKFYKDFMHYVSEVGGYKTVWEL